jgi:tripartite-type tricarboxylate transporter receptor subunit TctC
MKYVANSDPDGHTLVFTAIASVLFLGALQDVGFTHEDFEPIALFTEPSIAFAVGANSDILTFKELISRARQRPGEITHGTAGASSSPHVMASGFSRTFDVEFEHIPFDGSAQANLAALAGDIDVSLPAAGSVATQHASGEMRVLAVTGPQREPAMPDVPTLSELGYDYTFTIWRGIFAPAGTPSDVLDDLERIMERVFEHPDFQALVATLEPPVFTGRSALNERIGREVELFRPILTRIRG